MYLIEPAINASTTTSTSFCLLEKAYLGSAQLTVNDSNEHIAGTDKAVIA